MSKEHDADMVSAELTHNYVVHFAFAYPESDLRPDEQRWGNGSMAIQTDIEPSTEEEFKEIARTIGKLGGYEAVGITSIDRTEKPVTTEQEIFEGIIAKNEEKAKTEQEAREAFKENTVIEGIVIDD